MKASELIGILIKNISEYGDFHICIFKEKEWILAKYCMGEGIEVIDRVSDVEAYSADDQTAMALF